MSLALRPTFSLELTRASRDVLAQVFDRLTARPVILRRTRPPGGGQGVSPEHDHFVLTVRDAERHFWSPWLSVEIGPRAGGAHVFGRFSPHPSVWTAFMFGYLALGIVTMFALVFALGLSMSGGQPWTLGVACAAVVAMGVMWWASQIGQKLAYAQMEALRAELLQALEG